MSNETEWHNVKVNTAALSAIYRQKARNLANGRKTSIGQTVSEMVINFSYITGTSKN